MAQPKRKQIRKLANGYTPREQAFAIAISLTAESLREPASEFDLWDDDGFTNAERDAIKQQLAKLHNRLLRQSGLDGTEHEEG